MFWNGSVNIKASTWSRLEMMFNKFSSNFFFFLIGIHSMQGWTATTRHGLTRKRTTKRLKHTGIYLERT